MVSREAGSLLTQEMFEEELTKHPPFKWYHRFEVVPGSGVYTPGAQSIDWLGRFHQLNIKPDYFSGKRILDIGAFTGALSFFLEDHGAEVVALDVADPELTGFNLVHKMRGSTVQHVRQTVYNLHPTYFGLFDSVMFFGVFYHLKHPLLALERINSVLCDGGHLIGGGTTMDAWFHDGEEDCLSGVSAERLEISSLNSEAVDTKNRLPMSIQCLNDLQLCGFAEKHFIRERNNWFIPNTACVLGWLRSSGFKPITHKASTSPLQRSWNTDGLERSIMIFDSEKTGEPSPEAPQAYLGRFSIPVQGDLEQLQKNDKSQ